MADYGSPKPSSEIEVWSVTREKVDRALSEIIAVSRPRKVILFGSYVRGETGRNSDLDVLVVVGDEIANPRMESVRIRRALRGVHMPMDIVVVSETTFMECADVPGTVFREALRTGEVAYESAA